MQRSGLVLGVGLLVCAACGSSDSGGTGGEGASGGDGGSGGTQSGGSGGTGGATGGTGAIGGSAGTGGATGGTGAIGGSAGSGGQPCQGITGTYSVLRTRSQTSPGSCPPGYAFNPSIPFKVTADSSEASGHRFEIGYTNSATQQIVFVTCVNNFSAASCSLFATCVNPENTLTDQVTIKFAGNDVIGTLARDDSGKSCTINFDLTGKRE